MQLVINLLCQTTRNTFHCRQIVNRGIRYLANAPETGQQFLSSFCTDSFNFLQTGGLSFLVSFRTHAGNGKTMRFVPDLGYQHQDF